MTESKRPPMQRSSASHLLLKALKDGAQSKQHFLDAGIDRCTLFQAIKRLVDAGFIADLLVIEPNGEAALAEMEQWEYDESMRWKGKKQ